MESRGAAEFAFCPGRGGAGSLSVLPNNSRTKQLGVRCGFALRSTAYVLFLTTAKPSHSRFAVGLRCAANATCARLTLTGYCTRFIRHWRRSFRTLTGIIVPFGSVGPSASVRYGFALRGFRPLGLPRTHRALRSLHPALPALTPYSTGSGCYRFPQTATEVVGTEVSQALLGK